jgi:hypothetical protein
MLNIGLTNEEGWRNYERRRKSNRNNWWSDKSRQVIKHEAKHYLLLNSTSPRLKPNTASAEKAITEYLPPKFAPAISKYLTLKYLQ